MNISNEIQKHIEEKADTKAKANAAAVVKLLAEEVQKGEINVVSPSGGTIAINGEWITALESSILTASLPRFQKECADAFIAAAEKIVPAPKADPKTPPPVK